MSSPSTPASEKKQTVSPPYRPPRKQLRTPVADSVARAQANAMEEVFVCSECGRRLADDEAACPLCGEGALLLPQLIPRRS